MKQPAIKPSPIVAVTAETRVEHAVYGYNLGVDVYVSRAGVWVCELRRRDWT